VKMMLAAAAAGEKARVVHRLWQLVPLFRPQFEETQILLQTAEQESGQRSRLPQIPSASLPLLSEVKVLSAPQQL